MTEVRKPCSHGKVASMLLVSNSIETQMVSSMLYRFSKNTSRYPSNLKINARKKLAKG